MILEDLLFNNNLQNLFMFNHNYNKYYLNNNLYIIIVKCYNIVKKTFKI